ncbi:181_t:CDS:2 [Ambispora leptoticha]|uniref:181_t:CDS:1 n=1 Tax=Ambispora leptoticha TaxID=144679 RepID=A0A9N9H9P3_9GLOM|nr:181_t:CDS:2 [Ambispora leptoticha]
MKLPIPRLAQNAAAVAAAAAASSSAHVSGGVLNSKSHEMLITTSWPPANNSNTNNVSMANSLPVIPCPETIGQNPIGKPVPNKRGRKPLTTMPSTKKHIQNLTNQRAFRQRRENYIRNLETKATTLEYLYSQAQEEIKNLKEQLGSMRKQLFEGDSRNVCGGGALSNSNSPSLNDSSSSMMDHCPHNNPTDTCCGVGGFGGGLGGVVSTSSSSSSSRQQPPMIYSGQQVVVGNNGGNNRTQHMFAVVSSREGSPKDGMNCDLLMSDAAMSPISSIGSDGSSGIHSPPLMPNTNNHQSTNIYQDAAFQQYSVPQSSFLCEDKNGELCYCEPDPVSDAHLEEHTNRTFQGRSIINSEAGKTMWIVSNARESTNITNDGNLCDPITPTSYYHPISNGCSPSSSSPIYNHPLPSPDEPEPHWQQLQQQYYSQATHHNQSPPHHSQQTNNPKWMQHHDLRREEQSCGGR